MKPKKKLPSTMVGLTWKDTLSAFGRMKNGLFGAADVTTSVTASWLVNVIALVLFTGLGFLALMIKKPWLPLFLGVMAVAAWSGYKNAHVEKNRRITIDYVAAQDDFFNTMGDIWHHVKNFDLPYIDIPFLDRWLDDSNPPTTTVAVRERHDRPEVAAIDSNSPGWRQWFGRRGERVSDQDTVWQKPDVLVQSSYRRDELGTFLRESGIATTFPVERNAYQTARANQLYFRPGSDIEQILRNCRFVRKGSRIKFILDADGFVSGCFPLIGSR